MKKIPKQPTARSRRVPPPAESPGGRSVSLRSVNPLVRKEALRLAKGDRSRLKVVDRSTVVVANPPREGA